MTEVVISLGAFVDSDRLASKFNLVAPDIDGRGKVSAVLAQGVDFIDSVADKMQDGWSLVTGTAYDWDVEFLNYERAGKIARNQLFKNDVDLALRDKPEHMLLTVDVAETTKGKLDRIKSVFNLASDVEAARLAVSAYSRLMDARGRENGFYFKKGSQTAVFDNASYQPSKK